MNKLLEIICCFISLIFFLAVIAALQYGYEFGPKWLFRQNDTPSIFMILAGGVALAFTFFTCMCLLGFKDDEDDENYDDDEDSDGGYSED